ncbi:MAG: NUDIX hydrolase [Patescibacteria group bacterium]
MITPKNGLTDWAVVIIPLEPNGKTILVSDPFKPDPVYWKFAGGKKKGEETVLQTAIRELWEETGIKVVETDLKLIAEVDKSWHKKPHTVFAFKVGVGNYDRLLKFGNETKSTTLEVRLFEVGNISAMKDFFPPHRAYLKMVT